jgi:hypothetical protein
MRLEMLGLMVLAWCLFACSSKQVAPGEPGPGPVEAIKKPARLSEEGKTFPVDSSRVFFASLRILSEVSGSCPETLKTQDSKAENFLVKEPVSSASSLPEGFQDPALFNIQLRSIGFDETSYRFSFFDSRSSLPTPYRLFVRWRGGSRVEIEFFDQVELFRVDDTPILSFQAQEMRSGCRLTHQVNVWSEAPVWMSR